MPARQTIRHRRALARLEKQRAAAEAAYKATKKREWYWRLKFLTNACLRAV